MLMKCTKVWISAIWWRKLEKKGTELSQKKLIFSETHMEFHGRLAVSKLMDTVDKSNISAENEGTDTEKHSLLEKIVFFKLCTSNG